MKLVRVVAVHIFVACIFVFMANAFATAIIQKPEFTLSLPDGWVEIPSNVLSATQAEIKRRAPGAKIPKYDYGFQKQPLMKGMKYPFVLIQVIDSGRIPERQLKSIPKIDWNKQLKDRIANHKSIISSASVGKMQYDESAHIIWIMSQSDVVNAGKILGVSGIIPTETGVIQIHANSGESDFQGYLPIFRQIIMSTTVSPNLAYQPRWFDSTPILSDINWERVILAGIAGALLAVAGGFIRKRRVDK